MSITSSSYSFQRSSVVSNESVVSSGSYYSPSKEEVQNNLYCVNIRPRYKQFCPQLCIRKLQNTDNLLAIEFQNRLIQEQLWRKLQHMKIIAQNLGQNVSLGLQLLIQSMVVPEFKYIYCSSSMIKQIENAFRDNEVSFPAENFVNQLKACYSAQPRKMGKTLRANAGFFDGCVVKYHFNRDSIKSA